jgi:putative PIN family toxin of toxin-antitoxin system
MAKLPAWVLDTNVIVSGLISPLGPPGRLLDAVLARKLLLAVDDRILREYREVLSRPQFRIDATRLDAFLAIMVHQVHVSAPTVKGLSASEPDDTVFLEVAAASTDLTLVTGNLKHYPIRGRGTVRVVIPADAARELAEHGH